MDELKKHRERIGSIDTQIVELLAERFNLALLIAKQTWEKGSGIIGADEENAVIRRLDVYGARHGIPPGVVPCIYELIFDFMRAYHQQDQEND